jgi:5'-deoxynucleotidase YfbR-like HD superfamily hydrolase
MTTAKIETHSGRHFSPLTPVVSDICIDDIAHALANQCRFSGHTRVHYSVAEHSVRVSELLEEAGFGRDIILWGLLHDASEAYLVDLPTPLKRDPRFAFYREAERELMRAICQRFGMSEHEPQAVADADAILLATEARDLMPYTLEYWAKLTHEPLEEMITPWMPEQAKRNFISRYLKVCE